MPARSEVGLHAPRPDLAGKEPAWIEAAENPFSVRILDVRPVTLGCLSMTQDPQMATNAVSYGGETGESFIAQRPASTRRVEAFLRFRAPQRVVSGALFVPGEMEDKFALFVQDETLLLVRSWRRQVVLRASLRIEDDLLVVGPFEGAITADDEGEDYTRRALDFILRTHVLRMPWPAPLLGSDRDPRTYALQCMSVFGRKAHYASLDEPARDVPGQPLRVVTRLHFAVVQDDLDKARGALEEGTIDCLDSSGCAPLHYVRGPGPMLDLLLESGASMNDAADDGTTLLMSATQHRASALVQTLLERGADADAVDRRGFSALHRAAEMGDLIIVKALIAHGADPDRVAQGGFTPRSLATKREEKAVLAELETGARGSAPRPK